MRICCGVTRRPSQHGAGPRFENKSARDSGYTRGTAGKHRQKNARFTTKSKIKIPTERGGGTCFPKWWINAHDSFESEEDGQVFSGFYRTEKSSPLSK